MKREKILSKEDKIKYWGDGEWCEEDDFVQFVHNGIACEIRRIIYPETDTHIYGGHLCGYCLIPKDHPLHGKTNNYLNYDVHGGITYNTKEENEHWIGFDCAHAWDIVPSIKKIHSQMNMTTLSPGIETYKNMDFVINEVKKLADQINTYQDPDSEE